MKTNKIISVIITVIMLLGMNISVSAYNYSFESGVDYNDVLGKPTSTDEPVSSDPMDENIRRNNDAAYSPPPYLIFSGDIPTDLSSLYHGSGNTGGVSYTPNNASGSGPSASNSNYGDIPPAPIYTPDILNTEPLYYSDGSIGTITIPKLNITVKVYEGETLDNMKNGVGHFAFTSAWDGNCAIAGHNRGVPAAIGKIKDLVNGDKIIYETKYGIRTYKVYNKQKIADTDYSVLGWSDTNILTMITCVEGVSNLRWAISCIAVN